MPVSDAEIARLSSQFASDDPETILRWAWETFRPSIAATSSFQTQSLPLLHMISRVAPGMPVLFLDTGFHFPETLAFREQLESEFGLNVRVLTASMGHDGFRVRHGALYRRDPDLCCYINKVEPTQAALRGLSAWVTGIRRDQTATRSGIDVLSRGAEGIVKVCPIAHWTEEHVLSYIVDHDLPQHPLLAQGYRSIGCAPCTRAVQPAESARAGRWAGGLKTECGLHVDPPRRAQGS